MTINLNARAQRTSPNLFKNPAFSVIQGTASGTLANSLALPTASLGYSGETEWCIAASGGTPAYAFSSADERVTFTGAASTTAIYLLQRLESRDTNRIKGKTVTLSCEISNSLLTSVAWEVFRPTTTADQHGTIASPTQTLIASGTWTVSSTLARHSATIALPTEASLGLEIRLRVGAQTSGTWVISRPQLEEGGVATDFNCGDYVEELVKCQRFYRADSFRVVQTGSYAGGSIPFPIQLFSAGVRSNTLSYGGGGFANGGAVGNTTTMITVDFSMSNSANSWVQVDYTIGAHIP